MLAMPLCFSSFSDLGYSAASHQSPWAHHPLSLARKCLGACTKRRNLRRNLSTTGQLSTSVIFSASLASVTVGLKTILWQGSIQTKMAAQMISMRPLFAAQCPPALPPQSLRCFLEFRLQCRCRRRCHHQRPLFQSRLFGKLQERKSRWHFHRQLLLSKDCPSDFATPHSVLPAHKHATMHADTGVLFKTIQG